MLSVGARITSAFSLLFTGRVSAEVAAALASAEGQAATTTAPAPAVPPAAPAPDPGDRAVQLLALLQRDGRLVDFLREDLTTYSDAQVGTAARDVHAKSRAVLDRYLRLEPVAAEQEGDATIVSAASDPSTTRVVGHVPATGSARGIVRHRGWQVASIELPSLPPASGRRIVAPAEIEVS